MPFDDVWQTVRKITNFWLCRSLEEFALRRRVTRTFLPIIIRKCEAKFNKGVKWKYTKELESILIELLHGIHTNVRREKEDTTSLSVWVYFKIKSQHCQIQQAMRNFRLTCSFCIFHLKSVCMYTPKLVVLYTFFASLFVLFVTRKISQLWC